MNANELADKLQAVISVLNVHNETDCLLIANEAQLMLRQQQEQLTLSGKVNQDLMKQVLEQQAEIEKYKSKTIAELNKRFAEDKPLGSYATGFMDGFKFAEEGDINECRI